MSYVCKHRGCCLNECKKPGIHDCKPRKKIRVVNVIQSNNNVFARNFVNTRNK